MYSIFDNEVEINNDYSAITVGYQGNHIGIITEIYTNDQQREIRYADFFPVPGETIESGIFHAIVSSSTQGMVRCKILLKDTQHEVMQALRLTSTSITYRVEKTLVSSMLRAILDELHGNVAVPQFHIRGMNHDNNAINAHSWVHSKLAIANIDIQIIEPWYSKSCSIS